MPFSLTLIAAVFLNSTAAAEDCSGLFGRLLQRGIQSRNQIKTEYVDDNVAIVWFPTTKDTFTTTNLEVDNTVWGTQNHYYRKGSTETVQRFERMNNIGHFRFGLRVSEAELKKLRQILNQSSANKATCVDGACRALSEAGIQSIPFPANYTPTLNAIYTAVNRLVPGTRVRKVEFIGQNPMKSILGSKDFWTENGLVVGTVAASGFLVGMTGLIAIAVIDTVDPNGKFSQIVIPIIFGDD